MTDRQTDRQNMLNSKKEMVLLLPVIKSETGYWNLEFRIEIEFGMKVCRNLEVRIFNCLILLIDGSMA